MTTNLLALPISFRTNQDCLGWPHPRDHGASRLASHESLHGYFATALRAVRGARHGTISVRRPVDVNATATPEDRDHEHQQRRLPPLSTDQPRNASWYSTPRVVVHPQTRIVAFRGPSRSSRCSEIEDGSSKSFATTPRRSIVVDVTAKQDASHRHPYVVCASIFSDATTTPTLNPLYPRWRVGVWIMGFTYSRLEAGSAVIESAKD